MSTSSVTEDLQEQNETAALLPDTGELNNSKASTCVMLHFYDASMDRQARKFINKILITKH